MTNEQVLTLPGNALLVDLINKDKSRPIYNLSTRTVMSFDIFFPCRTSCIDRYTTFFFGTHGTVASMLLHAASNATLAPSIEKSVSV
jgi:hypothetical protein